MKKSQQRYLKIKRILDISLALTLLILTSPILIITALLIKLTSKGPILYKQKRPGKDKCIFTIFKFRTMRIELTKNGRPLLDNERITFVGRILRLTSIDELPQIINILRGDMSFIGPRPFLVNDLGTYTLEQEVRFNVLPGITSWTAIQGRNNLSIQEKYNLEIYYVKNFSLLLDIKIFFKTILVVLSTKNVVDTVNQPRIAEHFTDYEKKRSDK